MTTSATAPLDAAAVEAFAGQLMGLYTGGLLTYMIDLGHRTGLFAAAARGSGTSDEIADRSHLNERYVREWLGAMVTGGIMNYDPATTTYLLPPEHAAFLSGGGAMNMAPLSQVNTLLAKHVHRVALAFRDGGGVPYAEYRPEFTDVMDALGRGSFDEMLIDAWLPLVPGLAERLTAGARVADQLDQPAELDVFRRHLFNRASFMIRKNVVSRNSQRYAWSARAWWTPLNEDVTVSQLTEV
jgi:hypothetical protein